MLFCFCIRLVLKRHTPSLLVIAAVASYFLSATHVILELWRVGTSVTVNPETPFSLTYTSNYHQPLAHAAAYIYTAEVLVADAVLVRFPWHSTTDIV